MKTPFFASLVAIVALSASHGALIVPVNTEAFNLSGGGGISSLYDDNDQGGSSKFTKPDPNDPNTWTATGQAWQDDWQGNNPISGTNGKVGWVTFDFGSISQLDEMFLWNVSEATGQDRRVFTYNIYYANTPTVAPTSGSSVDYDFASGGWTQLGGTRSMLQWANGTGADGIETLGVSAQYIGLEFLTYAGGPRVGLNEAVFTAIPEPSIALLSGIGFLLLLRRKKH